MTSGSKTSAPPTVCVLMPVHNESKHLKAALDSLAAQTFQDFHLIVCNDYSTDDTGRILSAETRFSIEAFDNKEEPGLVSALNQLLKRGEATDSPYLARFDGDDLCHPERFDTQVHFLNKHPEVHIVGSDILMIEEEGRTLRLHRYPTDDSSIKLTLLYEDALAHPAVIFRREVLEEWGFQYSDVYLIAQDYDLWCRMAGRLKYANVSKPLIWYRVHSGSLSVGKKKRMREEAARIRGEYLLSLEMNTSNRTLLSHLIEVGGDAAWTKVTAGKAASLMGELELIFPGASETETGKSILRELQLKMFISMDWSSRLAWMLGRPSFLMEYLRNKWASLAVKT